MSDYRETAVDMLLAFASHPVWKAMVGMSYAQAMASLSHSRFVYGLQPVGMGYEGVLLRAYSLSGADPLCGIRCHELDGHVCISLTGEARACDMTVLPEMQLALSLEQALGCPCSLVGEGVEADDSSVRVDLTYSTEHGLFSLDLTQGAGEDALVGMRFLGCTDPHGLPMQPPKQ